MASIVRDSLPIIAVLSGLHVAGMTLGVGASLVMMLQSVGLAFDATSAPGLRAAARRVLMIGVTLSVVTGLLMFLPRAAHAVENDFFFRKMVLFVMAAMVSCAVAIGPSARPWRAAPLLTVVHFLLWGAVAVLGCMYTLLE